MISKTIIAVLLLLCFADVRAQDGILDGYIRQGLENNLVVQAGDFSLQKAMNALKVARSMYRPSLSFEASYTTATGGRSTDLPVGDMLNPVYSTLNQLTGNPVFPQIGNQTINFLPKNYYDAHFRATMPIVNVDIGHNRRINEKLVRMQGLHLEIYKRELVRDIKMAYYNYQSASAVLGIHRSGLQLAQESKRTNQKLLEAGRGLPAYVARAEAEMAQAEGKVREAEQQQSNARYYFNALLNRAAEEAIGTDADTVPQIDHPTPHGEHREELDLLAGQVEVQEEATRMARQFLVPKLNAFADFGSQAERMRFDRQSQYLMFGLQLSVPLYQGYRNKLKISDSKISVAQSRNQLAQARQQIELSVQIANEEVLTALKNRETAKRQAEAAAALAARRRRGPV